MPKKNRQHKNEELAQRFVERGLQELASASLHDLLAFLSVRRVAPGSALARFYEAFPKDGAPPSGRDALLAAMKRDATSDRPGAVLSGEAVVEILKMQTALARKEDAGIDGLRAHTTRLFFEANGNPNARGRRVLRGMMAAVAEADRDAREHLLEHRATSRRMFAEIFEQLLGALDREPIPELRSTENVARIVGALAEGLQEESSVEIACEASKDLFSRAVIPILAALTYPRGTEPPIDRERMEFDAPPSATARYPWTPPDVRPLSQSDATDLVGTWQGTMFTDRAPLRVKQGKPGPWETYLVIDDSAGRLEVTNFVENGLSRMILPQFIEVGERRRMACMYEAESDERADPSAPSHRGAWILEASLSNATELRATYFNDRGRRGDFVFGDHHPERSLSFSDAHNRFRAWSAAPTPREATA